MLEYERSLREEEWERARSQAQMTALMTWCEHKHEWRERQQDGSLLCACGMRFGGRSPVQSPPVQNGESPFKPVTHRMKR